YNFVRHGRAGYESLVRAMDANAAALAQHLGEMDALELIEGSPRLPLVIARVRPDEPYTGSDLVGELAKRRGWMVPAYKLPPDNEALGLDRPYVAVAGDRARDARRPQLDVAARAVLELLAADDVRDREPPARLQHARGLGEHEPLVRREVDDAVGHDDVETLVR